MKKLPRAHPDNSTVIQVFNKAFLRDSDSIVFALHVLRECISSISGFDVSELVLPLVVLRTHPVSVVSQESAALLITILSEVNYRARQHLADF